jgi:serine protease
MQPFTLPLHFKGLFPPGIATRRICLLLLALLTTAAQLSAQEFFYYYKGKKQILTLNTAYAYVVAPGNVNDIQQLNTLLKSKAESTKLSRINIPQTLRAVDNSVSPQGYWGEVKIQSKLAASQYFAYLKQLKAEGFKIASPYFSNAIDQKIGLTQYFYVKLKSAGDLAMLQKVVRDHKAAIVGQNKFMPLWYTLSTTEGSTKNALEMANAFYESGLFTHAEPDLMTENDAASPNDPFYASQWGLNNTGLYGGTVGTDINAEAAWELTKGSRDVIVAVVDHGFEMNHPDLAGNTFGTGFDTESGTTPAQVLGDHGTACAGIIAAIQDNNIGVTGVAPNARIMSVSNSLTSSPLSRQTRADGINWAWSNGASVISNSWSSSVAYAVIDDAIDQALTNGRSGLGTIVVFASGNNNGAVSYPANSNPDIVVVGAMSECGERKSFTSCDTEDWGSNFGPTLDVVAPGVLMPTTDRQGAGNGYNNTEPIHTNLNGTWLAADFGDTNYTTWFNGTSSATPVVAGVAALILSVNPCLSHDEVENIIEASAQKVGGYAYAVSAGRPNGTWFNQMGYGLVDAEEAVQDALDLLPTKVGFDLYTKDRPFDIGVEANPDAGPMWISEDIWVRKTADGSTTHQNPEYKTSSPNAVYVRISNRGRETSTCANLTLYFTKASTGLVWPIHWSNYFQVTSSGNILHGDKINTVSIPAIAPGASYVVEIPWFPPNPADFDADIHHFCLLSRIESPSDPMFNEQNGVGVSINVKNNNNIAWKNVSVMDDDADASDGAAIFVRNVERKETYIALRFLDKGFKENFRVQFFERGGQAIITGDKYFMERLKTAKLTGSIKQLDEKTILIYGADAAIGAFLVKPKENFLLRLKTKVQLSDGEETVLDVLQQNEKTKLFEGGERFIVRPGKDQKGVAVVAADQKDAILAYPNPVKDELFVKYSTTRESSDVRISVSGLYDPSKKTKLFEGKRERGDHQAQFNVRNLTKGIYVLTIQVDGKVLTERFVVE